MLSSKAVSLSIDLAKGVIKLADRVDTIMAEKAAVEGNLALPMPKINNGPGAIKMKNQLQARLDNTKGQVPDPLGQDRSKLKAALARNPSAKTLKKWYGKFWPEKINQPALDPDAAFFVELKLARPDWNLDDPETRLAAFYVASGQDLREKGYSWRVALTVVDVLAEFGAENTALFIRDQKLQTVIGSVLKHFAEPDLATFNNWSGLLRHAIAASLNGALDARGQLAGQDKWLDALFGALAEARSANPDGDNYVLGLLNGKGFPLLVGTVVDIAADRIGEEGSGNFHQVAAEVLKAAAPLVKASSPAGFSGFFRDHWGDLLRAGLSSVAKHGPAILDDTDPLVQKTLVAMVGRLAETRNNKYFTSETVFEVADAAIAVVAADPSLINRGVDEPWLKELIDTSVGVLANAGLRKAYSKESLQSLVNGALATFANHPEILVKNPGLARTLVQGVLTQIKTAGSFRSGDLADAAISGALQAIAENPDLLDFNYAEVVASFSGKIAKLIAAGSLSSLQARDLLAAATEALLENPALIQDAGAEITDALIRAVLKAADGDSTKMLAGQTVVDVAASVIANFSRHGAERLAATPSLKHLSEAVTQVLQESLKGASDQIGKKLGRGDMSLVLIEMVDAWFTGDLAVVDPTDPNFTRILNRFIEEAAA